MKLEATDCCEYLLELSPDARAKAPLIGAGAYPIWSYVGEVAYVALTGEAVVV